LKEGKVQTSVIIWRMELFLHKLFLTDTIPLEIPNPTKLALELVT
jgi:hypothetical protein